MSNFTNGVRFYTKGELNLTVNFPEREVLCKWCPFCKSEYDLKRFWCRITDHIIYDPFSGINGDCPIEFIVANEDCTIAVGEEKED